MAVVADELRSVNPATLEEVGSVPVAGDDEIAEAVGRAQAAQRGWATSTFEQRSRLLGRVVDVLLAHGDEIARTVTAEVGKPLVESYTTELLVSAENLRWLERDAPAALAPETFRFTQPYLVHKRGRVIREPLGVVAAITPWNVPLAIPLTQAATAVAAGNAVVLKPSELAPLTGDWVPRLFDEVGAPPGLVQTVHGRGGAGAALVSAPGVAKVVFTGSVDTGRRVAALAAERLRPVTLELGGRDPMLVFADADLGRTVAGAAWAAFANAGQLCSGVERIYVEEAAHERFLEALTERARALRIGRGEDPATDLGPLASEEQRVRVEALVERAAGAGANVVTGGKRPPLDLPGWFYEPTVLSGEGPDDEAFGPVVTVSSFRDEEKAVQLANASRFGLGASVWTRDPQRAERIAGRLEAGMVWTNDHSYSYGTCQAPWGGTKSSGYGRTHGADGLRDLTQPKLVDHDPGRIADPWWFPYDAGAVEGLKGLLGLLFERGLVPRALAAARYGSGLVRLARRYRLRA